MSLTSIGRGTHHESSARLLRLLFSSPVITKNSGSNQKSDNLQYNTLARWVYGTNDSSTKHLMLQAFFFHNFLQNSLQKSFQIYQNNTWTIRRLVDETIKPETQRIILKIVGFLVVNKIFLLAENEIISEYFKKVFLMTIFIDFQEAKLPENL